MSWAAASAAKSALTTKTRCSSRSVSTPARSAPAHSHPHTQISYVLDGEFTYTIEGNTRTMKKGDSIVVDGGKVHGCTCVKAGTLLDIFTPMREDFVK